MERNSASYMPEPEIMGDEAAWKVGKDRILAVQTCEDGYDYTLLDGNYNGLMAVRVDNLNCPCSKSAGIFWNPLDWSAGNFGQCSMRMSWSRLFEVGRQAVVVNDPIAELAFKARPFCRELRPL